MKPFPICHCAFDIFLHGTLDISATVNSIARVTLFCDSKDLAALAFDDESPAA